MKNATDAFKIVLNADDTTLFCTIEDSIPTHISNVDQSFDNEFIRVCDYLILNGLSLNSSKTKFMVFHPCQKKNTSQDCCRGPSWWNQTSVALTSLEWSLMKTYYAKQHINTLAMKISKYSSTLNSLNITHTPTPTPIPTPPPHLPPPILTHPLLYILHLLVSFQLWCEICSSLPSFALRERCLFDTFCFRGC